MADISVGTELYNQICKKIGLIPERRYTRLYFEFLATQDETTWLKDGIPNAESLNEIKKLMIEDRLGATNNYDKALKELEKQLAKEEKTLAKQKAKEEKETLAKISFFFAKMLKYARNVEKDTTINVDDLKTLATYMALTEESGGDYKTYYGDSPTEAGTRIYNFCMLTYCKLPKICGLENILTSEQITQAKKLIPDASTQFLKNAASNTFQLAKAGKAIAQNPDYLKEQKTIIENATAAALDKLVSRVNAELSADIAGLLDISMFTNIPVWAAKEMKPKIYTAEQALNIILNSADPKPDKQEEENVKQQIAEMQNRINAVKQEISLKYGNQLKKYNKGIAQITSTLNQSGMWYVNEISKYEMMMEKTIINEIRGIYINMQQQKFEWADATVETLTEHLTKPVNDAIIKAQQEALNKIVHLKHKAINKAKALAAQAIMVILGKLGV